MDNFELDITQYTTRDLEKVYTLPNDYDIANIEDKYDYFARKYEEHKELLDFLTQAKDKLLVHYYKTHESFLQKNTVKQTLDTEITKQHIGNNYYEYNYVKKLLVINSKFRKNFFKTASNDFIVELPYTFTNVLSMEFKAIEYTNSVYTVDKTVQNNTFKLNDIEYTLPNGNYTNDDIVDKLNDITPSNFFVSFDLNTGKIKIEECDKKPFTLCFGTEETFTDSLGYMLGYRKPLYKFGIFYISESILDIQGVRSLNIFVDDFINSSTYDNIVTITKDDYFSSKILARIPNAADAFHIQYEDNSDRIDKIRYYYGPVNIKKLHIRLLDDSGRLLQNNNVDYTILLKLQILP